MGAYRARKWEINILLSPAKINLDYLYRSANSATGLMITWVGCLSLNAEIVKTYEFLVGKLWESYHLGSRAAEERYTDFAQDSVILRNSLL